MKNRQRYFQELQNVIVEAAKKQDRCDLETINLIAPASPTPLKYYYNLPLRHNAIAEGLLEHRPYAGVEGFNKIESIAADAACKLFDAEHANVQPHSVSQANQAVYQALLENDGRVLAMRFDSGGHLTHGMKRNFSGRFFEFDFYGVDKNGFLDYKEVEIKALEFKPRLTVCGTSSYPRVIDFERLAAVAKRIGAYLMADLSHPAGLIVARRFPRPFPHCDVVTLTLDKTMLGPHGGIVLCKKELAERIDHEIHPGVQSSIPLRRIYEMASCLIESGRPWFNDLTLRIIKNMRAFENVFSKCLNLMVTGGSDTHLVVINTLSTFGLTGKDAEVLLEKIGILTNRQVIPNDLQKPYITSGIRLGTTWITARGYSENEAETIAEIILANLEKPGDRELLRFSKEQIKTLTATTRKEDVWHGEI